MKIYRTSSWDRTGTVCTSKSFATRADAKRFVSEQVAKARGHWVGVNGNDRAPFLCLHLWCDTVVDAGKRRLLVDCMNGAEFRTESRRVASWRSVEHPTYGGRRVYVAVSKTSGPAVAR